MDIDHSNGNGEKGQGAGGELICTYWHKCCMCAHTHVHMHKMLSVATVESNSWLCTHHHALSIPSLTHILLCIQTSMLKSHQPWPPTRLLLLAISIHVIYISATSHFWVVSFRRSPEPSRMTQCLLIHTLHFSWISFQHKTIGFCFFHKQTDTICKPCDDVRNELLYKEDVKAFPLQSLTTVV